MTRSRTLKVCQRRSNRSGVFLTAILLVLPLGVHKTKQNEPPENFGRKADCNKKATVHCFESLRADVGVYVCLFWFPSSPKKQRMRKIMNTIFAISGIALSYHTKHRHQL